jgi:hypothetical protein
VLLHFGPEHAASYNELVEVIRRNLLLADWCDDEHREVRPKQRCALVLRLLQQAGVTTSRGRGGATRRAYEVAPPFVAARAGV